MSSQLSPLVSLQRSSLTLRPDQRRVLLRPFSPGDAPRMQSILTRVLAISEGQVSALLEEITAEFAPRHPRLEQSFLTRYAQIQHLLPHGYQPSEKRCQLIGAYFLAEYSLESAALFNPSMVPHPDQTGLAAGALRFILSLRATGEGHISSITFRTGVIHPDQRIEVHAPSNFLTEPRQIRDAQYEKPLFARKLQELGLNGRFSGCVLHRLGELFTLEELRHSLDQQQSTQECGDPTAAPGIWMLALSNYQVQFQPEQEISERILFPAAPSQRNGIEDARFVRFTTVHGRHVYYATVTAFDGRVVMPELIETDDFLRFRFITLNGPAASNKGMALFPRLVNGRYAMLGRQDNESISLMYSDNVHFWDESQPLLAPAFPWEGIQIGNCGSPIETEAGWLVLSHGVGAMRKYCLGAFLLDRDDPSRVIRRLHQPLLVPNASEREGYVPNVVYTCGALEHQGLLIIPYGLADHATGFATVPLRDLLSAMTP